LWNCFNDGVLIISGSLQCGVFKPTNVISLSYHEFELDLSPSVLKRQCNEYMKLGMQGITLVFSSGDSGVGSRNSQCILRTDSASGPTFTLSTEGKIFVSTFSSVCPYVTSVGGTVLPPGGIAGKDTEIAVTRFPSGGGFSTLYPRPDYQAEVVGHYLDTYQNASDPNSYPFYTGQDLANVGANGGLYDRDGRGYPDVSAIGDNFPMFYRGKVGKIGGTSLSTPVFASMINLINEQRLAAGKSTVGFINPVLYANPQAFNDITVGSNPGCGTKGFAVKEGWDPVTGLGTPKFSSLLDVFMQQS
jgi:tripeptidyl-peptidase-1